MVGTPSRINASNSQGFINNPQGGVRQHFGTSIQTGIVLIQHAGTDTLAGGASQVPPLAVDPSRIGVELIQTYQPAPRWQDLFEQIDDPALVHQALFRTVAGKRLAPFQVEYVPGRQEMPDVQAALQKTFRKSGGRLFLRGREGIGKTREIAELANAWCEEGWTVCVARNQGEEGDPDARLDALASFPAELADVPLLLILDNLHLRVSKRNAQGISYSARVDALLAFLEKHILPQNLFVVVIAPNEPKFVRQMALDGQAPWNRFRSFDLPEFNLADLQAQLIAMAAREQVTLALEDVAGLVANSDRKPETLYANVARAARKKQPLAPALWLPTEKQSWQDSLEFAQARMPGVEKIYQALYLLGEQDIPTRAAYVARLSETLAGQSTQAALEELLDMGLLGLRNETVSVYSKEQLVAGLQALDETLLDTGGHDDAILEAVKNAQPRPPNGSDDIAALAFRLFRADQYTQAQALATFALEQGGDSARLYLVRGLARYMQADWAASHSDLTAAIQGGQDDETLYVLRGTVRNLLGDFEGLVSDLSIAIERGRNDAVIYSLRGVGYQNLGKLQEAEKDYSAAIALDPNNTLYYWGRTWVRRLLQDLKGAEQDASVVIERGFDLNLLQGLPSIEKGEWDTAGEYFGKPASVSPQADGFLYFTRGSLRYALHDFEGAEADLTLALERGLDSFRAQMQALQQTNLPGLAHARAQATAAEKLFQGSAVQADLYHMRGVARYNLQRYQDAEGDFRAAIANGKNHPIVSLLADAAQRALQTFPIIQETPRDDAPFYFGRALAHYSQSRLPDAKIALDAALARSPNDPFLHALFGAYHFSLGDPIAAKASLDRALAHGGSSSAVYALRGSAHYSQNKFQQAISDWDTAVTGGEQNVEIYFLRGVAQLTLNQFNSAESDLRAAIERGKDDDGVYYLLGIAHYAQERYADAKNDFAAAIARGEDTAEVYALRGEMHVLLDNPADAITDFEQALQRTPLNAYGYRARAVLAHDVGNFAQADSDAALAIEGGMDDLLCYFVRGSARFHLDKLADAVPDLTTAIQRGWQDANVYSMRALANFKREQPDTVVEDATAAIRRGAQEHELYYARGSVRNLENDYAGAEADFDVVIAREGIDSKPYFDRGFARLFQGKLALALEDMEQVVAAMPDNGAAYYWRGLVHEFQTDWQRAASDYDAALAHGHREAQTYQRRAIVSTHRDLLALAEQDCNQATALAPDDPLTHGAWGLLHLARGDLNAALARYQQALTANQNTDWHYDIGLAHLLAGHFEQAHAAYAQGLAENDLLSTLIARTELPFWTNRFAEQLQSAQARRTIAHIQDLLNPTN